MDATATLMARYMEAGGDRDYAVVDGIDHRQMGLAQVRLRHRHLEGLECLRLRIEPRYLILLHVAVVDIASLIDGELETTLR